MLGRIHHIVGKIYDKVIGVSVGLAQSNKPLSLEGISHLAKSAGDVKLMLGALLGATDINPEETKLELSVRETLLHVLKRCSKKAYQSVRIEGDADFNVLGNREIFESIVAHVLDNAFYYVEKGEATTVVCILNKDTKTLSILNDGPTIAPQDMPYIFDLGYTVGKDSLGLGLTYCKKMLEGMRSGIRLISKPNDPWVQFCLYFPKYAQLPPESQRYDLKDNEDDTSNADSFHYPSGNCC
jgi:signal transduction histidine kinase